jgi:ABC-type transporter Mla subunit MlaD
LLGAGNTHAYTGLHAIVRAVVNAISRHEDPFKDPIVNLTTIIKSLQTNNNALEALLKSSRDVGDEFA